LAQRGSVASFKPSISFVLVTVRWRQKYVFTVIAHNIFA
jgi:hypothetical protein